MSVKAYLNFNGNCREAVEFYAQIFGDKSPRIMLFGDAPANDDFTVSEDMKALVMHAEVKVYETSIMFSDCPPGVPFVTGNNISLIVSIGNIEEVKSVFNKLQVGGTVLMELQETFWSKCYGHVIDKFGIGWQISYEGQ